VQHSVESARQEWDEGYRRLQAESHDRARYRALMDQVDAIRDELRRRVGQTFTLDELARAYAGADSWVRERIAEESPRPGWVGTLSLVEAAAFHLYSRAAIDYAP
jgi:hypothetical protein